MRQHGTDIGIRVLPAAGVRQCRRLQRLMVAFSPKTQDPSMGCSTDEGGDGHVWRIFSHSRMQLRFIFMTPHHDVP
jgi:hypothetical protein